MTREGESERFDVEMAEPVSTMGIVSNPSTAGLKAEKGPGPMNVSASRIKKSHGNFSLGSFPRGVPACQHLGIRQRDPLVDL